MTKQCTICSNECYSNYFGCLYCIYCKKAIRYENTRIWKKNNPDNTKKHRNKNVKKHSEELTDLYVRQILIQRTELMRKDITIEMIEIKREQLRIKRILRDDKTLQ